MPPSPRPESSVEQIVRHERELQDARHDLATQHRLNRVLVAALAQVARAAGEPSPSVRSDLLRVPLAALTPLLPSSDEKEP